MARSQRKTTIAILRETLGPFYGREDQFAKLATRSRSWVKKVSAGIVPLTEEAALTISDATGVSFQWLLGSPRMRPFSVGRPEPYTGKYAKWYREENNAGRPVIRNGYSPHTFIPRLISIGFAAGAERKAGVFVRRLTSFMDQMQGEFGANPRAREIAELLLDQTGKTALEQSGAELRLKDLWFVDRTEKDHASFGPEGSALRELTDKGIDKIAIKFPKREVRYQSVTFQAPSKPGLFLTKKKKRD